VVTVSPATIGGRFTNVNGYLTQPIVVSGDGGRTNLGSFTGSGSSVNPDALSVDNGSTTGVTGNWVSLVNSQALKQPWWTQYPGWANFAFGSCEPGVGGDNYQFNDPNPPYSPAGGSFFYFDNEWNGGEAGPAQNAVRSGSEWVTVCHDPAQGVADLGSVKGSPDNIFQFPGWPSGKTCPAISSFKTIRSYVSCIDPDSAINPNTNPNIRYDSSWDTFGFAHWDRNDPASGALEISFECMFWTRNYNQGPFGFTQVETGINFGDGTLWDLYLWNNALDGGVTAMYSYGIFLMQPAFQTSTAWVDILAGIRYFAMHYVTPTGGAPSNPLNTPFWQIIRGWESCSTNYGPAVYKNNDYRLVMA
jgi:hypothetical protein